MSGTHAHGDIYVHTAVTHSDVNPSFLQQRKGPIWEMSFAKVDINYARVWR